MLTHRDDEGSITVLIIGYTTLTIGLLMVGIVASKLFLARRALAAAADQAALQAAQAVSTTRIYDNGLACGDPLPLSTSQAAAVARTSLADSTDDLRRTFHSLGRPRTSVHQGVVAVTLTGAMQLPFQSYLGWLDPGHGTVTVTTTAHAQSPVADC
jgi:uncharacterized membrane protein